MSIIFQLIMTVLMLMILKIFINIYSTHYKTMLRFIKKNLHLITKRLLAQKEVLVSH